MGYEKGVARAGPRMGSTDTGVSEATFTTLGRVERADRNQFSLTTGSYHHLADSLSIIYNKGFGGKVDQNDAYFSTIVGIDCSGRIKQGDSVAESETAAGTHLTLITFGERDAQSCRNKCALKRRESHGAVKICPDIEPGRKGRCISGQRMTRGVYYFDFYVVH